MILLTPQQEMKYRRLKAEAQTLHATFMSFRERRAGLINQLSYLDGQVASEESRGRAFPAAMREEIQATKRPIEAELAALADEETRTRTAYQQAAQLAKNLDAYVAALRRAS